MTEMKKTLIALTLASLSVTASADVILYGKIRGGVEVNRSFTNSVKDKGTSTKIVDYGSLIGFKGHEDLNNNLRAIWQVEQDVSIGGSDSKKTFATRDSFVGLTGGFGTAKAGYLSTPTKTTNDRLDQWEYSDNAAGLGIYTRSNNAVKRAGAISYETPNFGGFTAQAYVSPSDNNNGNTVSFANDNTSGAENSEKAIYGAKMGYENAGFFADVAGTYVKNSKTINGTNHDGYQAAANVGFENNNWLAGVGYQQARYVDTVSTLTGESAAAIQTLGGSNDVVKGSKEIAASAAYTINNSVRLKGSAAYGFDIDSIDATNSNNPDLDGAKYVQGIVGADYLLSKRTTLNGQVGYLEFKSSSNADKMKKGTVGVGMTHKF